MANIARNLGLILATSALVAGAAGDGVGADPEPVGDLARRIVTSAPVGPGPLGPPAVPIELSAGPKTSLDLIDACVAAAMQRHDTPGVAVAVIRNGDMIYQQGYGEKRRGHGDPVGPDTYFRIGSVTKQLTAAAVMQQVELGAVDLADPVTVYVPELALAGRWDADVIRVHHLLTHSSGYPDNLGSITGATDEQALTRWVTTQSGVSLHAPPGTFWNYSNPNFMLAGLVAERASGVPYREYMETRVFDAAGLTRTTFDPAAVVADGDFTYGHYTNPSSGREVVYAPDTYDNGAAAPAGWAFSTAGDLARWALLLTDGGGDVLSPASAAAMQTPHVFVDPALASWYGYGIFVDLYEGLEVHQHGGNVPGWGTYLLWVPARRDVVAVIANTFASLPEAAYCILDNVLGVPGGGQVIVDPEPLAAATVLDSYAGFDSLGTPYGAEIVLDGGGLTMELYQQADPDDILVAPMVRAFRDTYVVDLDDDGTFDLDLSFVTSQGAPGRTSWLVNRSLVFERVRAPRQEAVRP